MIETKGCQDCGQDFEVSPEDKLFYEKFKAPISSWCFDCRLQRRMAFRNERVLYKRTCDIPGHDEEMLSLYAPEKKLTVYDQKSWWGDGWDALDYGRDYDFSRPFFEQFKELIGVVPWTTLFNMNAVNSDYCNMTTDNKNCYLVFGGDFNEDCSYSTFNFHSRNSQDMYLSSDCELSYDITDSRSLYNCMFISWSKDCADSAFLHNCIGCTSCIGCVNLRNKSYCILNKQYSREEYKAKKKELDFGDAEKLENFREEFEKLKKTQPFKYADIIRVVDVTGNRINDAKNCQHCFDIFGPAENLRDVFLTFSGYTDSYACSHGGHGVEECYEASATFSGCQKLFCTYLMATMQESSYSYNCRTSSNLFGCVGVSNKKHCVLNKQYSKEEHEELVAKIKKHMDEMPYTDKKGRMYKYGDFFPIEISPFAYNETVAQEYYPLTKEEALSKGYHWRDPDPREHTITIRVGELPNNIAEVKDDIVKEIIECEHQGKCNENCTTAFRILPEDLKFYRRLGVTLPRLCSNCRHQERLKKRAPNKLWYRKCQCAGPQSDNKRYTNTAEHTHGSEHCPNEFETPYSPEREEIVYCEPCYNKEVI